MRILFHLFALALLFCVFKARFCDEHLYPFVFCMLGAFILSQQVYDLCLYWFDYLIDLDNMPPTHYNRIWYNKELFKQQTKILFYTNILFGTFSMICIAVGFKYMNADHDKDDEHGDDFLLCYNGD